MNEVYVHIQGRLVADPVIKYTQQGQPFTTFRVATASRRPVPGQPGVYTDGPTSFYNCAAWRGLGANVSRSLHKGDAVLVHGRQQVVQFLRADNSKGTDVQIDVQGIGPDLTWGVSQFTKVTKAAYPQVAGDRSHQPEVQEAFAEARGDGPGGGAAYGMGDPQTDPYLLADDHESDPYAARTRPLGGVAVADLSGLPEVPGENGGEPGEDGQSEGVAA